MAKRRSTAEMIKDEVAKLGDDHRDDDELNPNDFKLVRDKQLGQAEVADDERVLDELLASIPRNQGYYLKLYKELRPNDFEFKLRVDNYDTWTDLEWEVSSLVRAYTDKQPQKWGSGRYRIIIWRDGGIRGPKYKPIDFVIDALETPNGQQPLNPPPSESMQIKEQLGTLNELIKTLSSVNPTTSPADTQKLIADSFNAGQAAKSAEKIAESNTNATLMTALVQVLNRPPAPSPLEAILVAVLPKLLDMMNKPAPAAIAAPPAVDPLDTLVKLKQAGIIPDAKGAGDQLESLKSVVAVVASVVPMLQNLTGGGKGEPASVMAEVVRTVGPQVGQAIHDVTTTIKTAIAAKSGQPLPRPVPRIEPTPPTSNAPALNQPPIAHEEVLPTQPPQEFEAMLPMFKPVRDAVEMRDHGYFPQLRDLLLRYGNESVYDQLLDGDYTIDQLIAYVKPLGGGFLETPQGRQYITEFLEWARHQRDSSPTATCVACNTDFTVSGPEELIDNPNCPNCGGTLAMSMAAQPESAEPVPSVQVPTLTSNGAAVAVDAPQPG